MDDCKLYTGSEKDLEEKLAVLEQIAARSGLEFGIKKCAKVHMKRGTRVHSNTATSSEQGEIPQLKNR